MTKQELAQKVAGDTGLSQNQAKDIVDTVFKTIADELAGGGEVAVSGFGKFSVSERSAREGRNPATGETIQIAASNVPGFKAGKALKDAVN
jgi:DNA-binding protein HU-beta